MNRRDFIRTFAQLSVLPLLAAACENRTPTASPTALNSPLNSQPGETPATNATSQATNALTSSSPIIYSGGKGKLAFALDTDGSGSYQVGVLDMATGNIKVLTSSPKPGDAEPKWAPGGQTIYFTSARNASEGYVIYKMNQDGSQQTPVARVEGRNTINTQASVSPDGAHIVFHTNRDGNMEIYTANADGSDARNLTQHPANDVTASWLPDGSKIIFASDRNENVYQLLTMDPDGSHPTVLVAVPDALCYAPKYSPDGKQIAFLRQATVGGNPQIAVATSDGSSVQIVTNGFDAHTRPVWMNNSTLIYASRVSDALTWNIYMLTLDTHTRTPLLAGSKSYTDPDWISG